MRDHWGAVVAFRNHRAGVREGGLRVADFLLSRRLFARIRHLGQVLFIHHKRELLVLDFDLADGIFSSSLGDRGNRYQFVAFPLWLLSHTLDHAKAFHTRHLFRFGSIERRDLRVRVRAAQDFAEEHTGPIDVVRIFGATARLLRAINALDALAYQRPLAGLRPIVFAFFHGLSSPFVSAAGYNAVRPVLHANVANASAWMLAWTASALRAAKTIRSRPPFIDPAATRPLGAPLRALPCRYHTGRDCRPILFPLAHPWFEAQFMVSPVDPQCYGNFTRTDKLSLIRRSRGDRGLSGEDAARNGHTRAPKKVAS